MPAIHGMTFRNETIRLDGQVFENCTFDHCLLQYGGMGSVSLDDCTYVGCNWALVDAAASTVNFLALMYGAGEPALRDLIQGVLDGIRTGVHKPQSRPDLPRRQP